MLGFKLEFYIIVLRIYQRPRTRGIFNLRCFMQHNSKVTGVISLSDSATHIIPTSKSSVHICLVLSQSFPIITNPLSFSPVSIVQELCSIHTRVLSNRFPGTSKIGRPGTHMRRRWPFSVMRHLEFHQLTAWRQVDMSQTFRTTIVTFWYNCEDNAYNGYSDQGYHGDIVPFSAINAPCIIA